MLIRRQLEVALVDLCDLPQSRLEVLLWFVLHTTVLDKCRIVVAAVFASDPTKFVDITREVEWASRSKLISKSPLNLRLEVLESHSVNGVL